MTINLLSNEPHHPPPSNINAPEPGTMINNFLYRKFLKQKLKKVKVFNNAMGWLKNLFGKKPQPTSSAPPSSKVQLPATPPPKPAPVTSPLPAKPPPTPLPTAELEKFRLALETLKDRDQGETPYYITVVPARTAQSDRDEVFLFQIWRTKRAYNIPEIVFKAYWSDLDSIGQTPKKPVFKSQYKLPFPEFLTQGSSGAMTTPEHVIQFVQILYDGYGIRIKFD